MVRNGKKYVGVLPAKKLILLLVITAVILLGYSTAIQAAETDPKESGKISLFDPFTLTGFSTYLTSGEKGGGPWNPRALLMIPYRGWKRSPHEPPWPPHKPDK